LNEIYLIHNEKTKTDCKLFTKLSADFTQIIVHAKKIIDIKNDIAMTKVADKDSLHSTEFSTITAVVALMLCFTASSIFTTLMLGIGIASAMSSLWDLYTKHVFENKILSKEDKKIHRLIEDSVEAAEKSQDPELRFVLTQHLSTLIAQAPDNPIEITQRHFTKRRQGDLRFGPKKSNPQKPTNEDQLPKADRHLSLIC
jgi:hypothetical protein